ncbi:MAG TPA: glycosyltransferase family 2 protein, partial [Candidatus Binatia bacterium]|nr:glycosyltransferase family 2 protein [Candidatus Binatia bacterium]
MLAIPWRNIFDCVDERDDTALNAPVVLIVFNRPDLTIRVWETIRAAKPGRLFVIADGPRNPDERAKCDETRRIIENVDWQCDLRRDYSENNLGCRNRIASGLDWVFSQVNDAIILEDDCVPSPTFFGFCTELLDHYRDNQRVMHVCGSNFIPRPPMTSYSYYFSKYANVWGWATWARAWRHMDLEMKRWQEFVKNGSKAMFPDARERRHWIRKLNPFFTRERTDSWAYPWQFAVWASAGLCVAPVANLVS